MRDMSGPTEIIEHLIDIRKRRASAPTKAEIQEAIRRALEAGMTVTDVAELTGIPRQQFYQGKYDLGANRLNRRPTQPVSRSITSPAGRKPRRPSPSTD